MRASDPEPQWACFVDQLLGKEALRRLLGQTEMAEPYVWSLPDPGLPLTLSECFDLDSLVMGARGNWGGVRVAGRQQGASEWIAGKAPSPELVRKLLCAGHSVVINDLQDKLFPVFSLCQELSALLVSGVNCNAYLTPARAQGLAKHYDDEDVIVVQLRGAKTWRLYPPARALNPFPGLDYCQPYVDDCQEFSQQSMTPGKALYLPRGVPHEAFCTDDSSLHLTLSIQAVSQADLLHALVEAVAVHVDDPHRLRRRLPLAWLKGGRATGSGLLATRALLSSLASDLNAASLDQAMATLLGKRFNGLSSPFLSGCSELDPDLHDSSALRLCASQVLVHVPSVKKAFFKGGSLDLGDKEDVEFVGQLASRKVFLVDALPAQDAQARLLLARRLIDLGLIERV